LNAEIRDLEATVASLTAEEEELVSGNSLLAEHRTEIAEKMNEKQIELASNRAEKEEAERALEEISSLSDAMAGDRETKEKAIADYEAVIAETEKNIEEKKTEMGKRRLDMQAISNKLSEITNKKLELEALRNRKDKESKEKNDDILNLERERSRLEMKKDSASREEQQITEKLWESYELTLGTAEKYLVELSSMGEATKRISELKSEKKKLGDVNINSIEEYEQVSERYEFLSVQCADLEKAKTELLKMISEITGEMETIFSEQFKIINKNFGETFSELFDGGKAELLLEDEHNVLECPIEIKVQPPGKNVQNIDLLSGGEKGLSAIALLFAILKVSPAPFCFFDEVEAALDDVNVVRYAQYARRMTKNTQFILITHRRGTMEEADILYGVTMQEKGVSKLLELKTAEMARKLGLA
jgi:chromosome segregation protein